MNATDDKLSGRRPTVAEVQRVVDRAISEGHYEEINFLHVICEDRNLEQVHANSAVSHATTAVGLALATLVAQLTASQRGRLVYDSHVAYATAKELGTLT